MDSVAHPAGHMARVSPMSRIAVIGAGPAGLSTAYLLSKAGMTVDVYEAAPWVGGLARSFDLWGERVDIGPHIFAGYNDEVLQLWHEVVGTDFSMIARTTKVICRGQLYSYPLRVPEVLRGLGLAGTLRAAFAFLRAQLSCWRQPISAADVIVQRFGRYIYEVFFRSYCQKLWGREPEHIDAAFAATMVGDISIPRALLNAISGRRSTKEKQLQDFFPYAHQGAGAFTQAAAHYVSSHGGSIF